MSVQLKESTAENPVKKGSRWRVVLAKPGKGSSGDYSADVLREFGPTALAPGFKAFFDHNPDRSIKDMVGAYPEGAYWDDDKQELVGDLDVFEHWKPVIDAVGPYAEASIYMMGEKDSDGNVTRLLPHRTNGVDLVGYAGLEGSGLSEQIEALVESAQKDSVETSADVQERNDHMEIKDVADRVDSLQEKFDSLLGKFDALAESLKPAVPSEDETDIAEAAKTVYGEESLSESAKDRAFAAVKAGTPLAEAIATEKKIAEEYQTLNERINLTEAAGRTGGGDALDITVGRWSK